MSIRFIIGRAGSGKTCRCLEQIRSRLRDDAAIGHRLILLVPEQASFQMERALIETPELSGYARCEVLSFQRLANRIFADTAIRPWDEPIGSLGRLMLIRRIIRQERAALRLLGRVADKPGLIKQVASTLEELMRENVTLETLAEAAEGATAKDPLQAAKLQDITRLYRAYLAALLHERTDPAQHLALAAERAAGCPWLSGAEIWVDGFAGFTGQEYQLLIELARQAANMEITMLVEPTTSAVTAAEIPAWSFSIFSRTEKTIFRLRQLMSAAGLSFEAPICLSNPNHSRFENAELIRLEEQMFCDGSISAPARLEAKTASAPAAASIGAVEILELPDRRCEVDAAVAEIERLRREASPPMRYRDIAVIVRDLAPYHDLLTAAFQAHHIPVFIDRRQPTTQHPLVEMVRALLAVAGDDCRLESVRLLLKTGLLPIASIDTDLLENYLLAHGIAGWAAWQTPWQYTRIFCHKAEDNTLRPDQQAALERVNVVREQWCTVIGPWLLAASPGREATGREWAHTLYRALERLQVARQLHDWAEIADQEQQPDQADAHRQVWADFVQLLDEFVRALGNERILLREFQETLEAGLAEFNLGLAPATLDQVLVGAIERSRHPPVRATLLLGFDDRHFPMRRNEDPLLGDAERRTLEQAGAALGPSRDQQLLDERMLAYIALTRASERVVITYPRTESDGQPCQPSPYLRDVLGALPGLSVRRQDDPRGKRSTEWLTRTGELGARLAREFRCRPELAKEADAVARARWNGLYEIARLQDGWRAILGRSLAGLKYHNQAELNADRVSGLNSSRMAASVSRLERFAACPFAHYVEYMLRLEPRVEADMGDVDLGNLCHMILEKFIGDLAATRGRLAELEDDEIGERVALAAGGIVAQVADDLMLTEARNAFLMDRSREHLRRVLRWQRNSARVGTFNPQKVEHPFGYDKESVFKIITPKRREVYLRGRIDRVDLAELGGEILGLVIDYKHTTDRRLDLAKAYHGLTLQLVGYLLALKQTGQSLAGRPIRPVAAFYLPLLEPFKTVSHPTEEKATTYQWRGVADASALPSLDCTVEPGGRSPYMAARLTKAGEPYENSDLARNEQFVKLMAHTAERMGQLADRILDGEIAIAPYRLRRQMPCTWCAYHSICRYEIEQQPPRALEALRKADVFERMKGDGK